MRTKLSSVGLKGYLELIASSISVIAACGYVSLRSFANFIGLAGLQELNTQQLLYECYAVSVALGIVAVPLSVVALGIATTARLLAGLRKHGGNRPDRSARTSAIPVLLRHVRLAEIAGAITIAAAVAVVFRSFTPGVLVQSADEVARIRQYRAVFVIVVAMTLTLWCFVFSSRTWALVRLAQGARSAAVVRSVTIAAACLMLWSSITAYNVHLRTLNFPFVILRMYDGDKLHLSCGLLLYTTVKSRFLWNIYESSGKAEGSIQALPRQDMDQVTILPDRLVSDVAHDWRQWQADTGCKMDDVLNKR